MDCHSDAWYRWDIDRPIAYDRSDIRHSDVDTCDNSRYVDFDAAGHWGHSELSAYHEWIWNSIMDDLAGRRWRYGSRNAHESLGSGWCRNIHTYTDCCWRCEHGI